MQISLREYINFQKREHFNEPITRERFTELRNSMSEKPTEEERAIFNVFCEIMNEQDDGYDGLETGNEPNDD